MVAVTVVIVVVVVVVGVMVVIVSDSSGTSGSSSCRGSGDNSVIVWHTCVDCIDIATPMYDAPIA